jgi:hypothetical protein
MKGRRIEPDPYGWFGRKMEPGDYVRVAPTANADGTPLRADFSEHWRGPYWLVCTPNGHVGNLANHTVVEHEDGTITASPSILISGPRGMLWHGYLERGVWRSV